MPNVTDLPAYQRAAYKLLHSLRLTSFARFYNRSGVTILCYHGITGRSDPDRDDRSRIWVTRSLFRSHLQFLNRHYRVISLRRYLEARKAGESAPPHSVILTFDDGLRNFLTVAAPVLRELRLPATLFVVTGAVESRGELMGDSHWTPEDDRRSLSWREIRALASGGEIEIGSHTCSHPQLTDLSSADVRRELSGALQALRANLGEGFIPCLAYPYGISSPAIEEITRELGYSCALTTGPGCNSRRTDLFRLRRAVVRRFDAIDVFAARVSGVTGSLRQGRDAIQKLSLASSRLRLFSSPRPKGSRKVRERALLR